MRQWLRFFLILALPLSILAACGTDRESASPVDTSLDLTGVADDCPAGAISEDIAEIFPTKKNLAHKATITCGQIFKDFGKGKQSHAIQRAFAFFQKTLQQNEAGQLLDPDPSVEAEIVHLFAAIFAGLGFDLPEIDPEVLMEGEYAFGELTPNGPPLITVSGHAGIDDGGGLFGPVSVFIVKIFANESELSLSSESHPCPAGVDSSFDCYPLFFDYTVSPESNVNPAVGLQLGQCNVSPGGVEVLLLSPEGFLPEDDAPTGVVCGDVEAEEVTMTGWRSYAWAVLEPISPLFRVTSAFAGKNPIGGRISAFSPVAPADPSSGGGEGIGSISGRVFDNSTESAIQGATVELFTSDEELLGSTTTNSDGNYSFSELDAGAYIVQADAVGYSSASSEVVTLTEENPDAENVNIGLEPDTGEPPPPGTDIIVFNDINVFDETGLPATDNVTLLVNLLDFPTDGSRGEGSTVWVDCRNIAHIEFFPSEADACGGSGFETFRSTIANQGFSLVGVTEGSLTDIPADVKVVFLWIPDVAYPVAEVNALKQFASEGGRVVFVGEHAGFYGDFFSVENDFLLAMGAQMQNAGGIFVCEAFTVIPSSAIRPHQVTEGVDQFTMGCSSEITLGENDFALILDPTEEHILVGVAAIDTTPIEVVASRSVRPAAVAAPAFDPLGRPIRGSR